MPKNSKSTRSAKISSGSGNKTASSPIKHFNLSRLLYNYARETGKNEAQNQSVPMQRTWPQWPTASHNRPTSDGDTNTSSSQGTGTHQNTNDQGMTPMQRWESETLREGPYNAVYSYAPRYDEATYTQSNNDNTAEHWSMDGNSKSQK